MACHQSDNIQVQSKIWYGDTGNEDWWNYPWLPWSELEETPQDLGWHSNFPGSDAHFQHMPDGLYPYLEKSWFCTEIQAPSVAGQIFESNGVALWPPGANTWSELATSRCNSAPGNGERVQQLRSPTGSYRYIRQAQHGKLEHLGQSSSMSDYHGNAATFSTRQITYDVHPSLPELAQSTLHPAEAKPVIEAEAECSIQCPHGCGTSLTGTHALGNLTRHLKSRACAGSGRVRPRYRCPVENCTRVYSRTDGLKVHMRRRHGAPMARHRSVRSRYEGVTLSAASGW